MDSDLRREYEKSRERNLTDYWLSIGQEFTYSINRLSKLIGNAHELSTRDVQLFLSYCSMVV
jgi:hypothetical protein